MKQSKVGSAHARFFYPTHANMHFLRQPTLDLLKSKGLLVYDDPAPIKAWLSENPVERYRELRSNSGIGTGHSRKLFTALGMEPPVRRPGRNIPNEVDELREKIARLEEMVARLENVANRPAFVGGPPGNGHELPLQGQGVRP